MATSYLSWKRWWTLYGKTSWICASLWIARELSTMTTSVSSSKSEKRFARCVNSRWNTLIMASGKLSGGWKTSVSSSKRNSAPSMMLRRLSSSKNCKFLTSTPGNRTQSILFMPTFRDLSRRAPTPRSLQRSMTFLSSTKKALRISSISQRQEDSTALTRK